MSFKSANATVDKDDQQEELPILHFSGGQQLLVLFIYYSTLHTLRYSTIFYSLYQRDPRPRPVIAQTSLVSVEQ